MGSCVRIYHSTTAGSMLSCEQYGHWCASPGVPLHFFRLTPRGPHLLLGATVEVIKPRYGSSPGTSEGVILSWMLSETGLNTISKLRPDAVPHLRRQKTGLPAGRTTDRHARITQNSGRRQQPRSMILGHRRKARFVGSGVLNRISRPPDHLDHASSCASGSNPAGTFTNKAG